MSDRLSANPESWWWKDARQRSTGESECPALTGVLQADVAIVGGGYTGLWTAIALKERQPSLRVALIEAGECGSGASGKNGGKVHGYWASLASISRNLGPDAALAIARAGARAQDAIRALSRQTPIDFSWREGGNLKVSAAPAQDPALERAIDIAEQLGVPDMVQRLSAAEVQARCQSPVFRAGVWFPEGANLHPARLARALRAAALQHGVLVFEQTPMISLDIGTPNRVQTPNGEIIARDIVLATNTALAKHPALQRHVCVLSSYALMTEPAPDRLEQMGWTGEEGITDSRMFLHYTRKTTDGRVLMGSGSGPIGYGNRADGASLLAEPASIKRSVAGLRRLLPAFADVSVEHVWAGALDVSADRLPFFKTFPGTRVHYGFGYSGHGVNPTYIGGQCLASLVLEANDEWSSLPLCTRTLPAFPPEPLRTIGGRIIRRGVLRVEEAEEREETPPFPARAVAALPGLLGLRIGIR